MDTTYMLHQMQVTLWNLNYTHWKEQTLFSVQWWGIIAVIIFSYTIWWKLVNKSNLTQLLFFGSLVSVGRILMDLVGSNIGLWSYNVRESPFIPSPFLHNFTISPLVYMLLFQYTSSWNSFLIWNAIITGVYSFIVLPLMVNASMLTLYNWNYLYAFIVVFFIPTLSRAVCVGVSYLEQRHQCDNSSNIGKTLIYQPVTKPLDTDDDNK